MSSFSLIEENIELSHIHNVLVAVRCNQEALYFIIPFHEIASVQNERHKLQVFSEIQSSFHVIVSDCFAVSLSYQVCQDSTNIGCWFQKAQFGLVNWSFPNKFPDFHPFVKPVKTLHYS